MSATAPSRADHRAVGSPRVPLLVALLVLALVVFGPQAATGRVDRSPAAVPAGRTSALSGADPLACLVTLLVAHRVRCDYLTGGTTFP